MQPKLKSYLLLFFFLFIIAPSFSQNVHSPIKKDFGNDRYIQFMTFAQLWGRITENNPGSLVNGNPENITYDISVRRFRMKLD